MQIGDTIIMIENHDSAEKNMIGKLIEKRSGSFWSISFRGWDGGHTCHGILKNQSGHFCPEHSFKRYEDYIDATKNWG